MNGSLVWFEALTPKQALLFSIVAREYGGPAYITTRHYDVVEGIPARYGVESVAVGEYGGSTLEEKLSSSIRRMEGLLRLALERRPEVHVTFVSPDSTRVAFGLGIPVITMSDTPHSASVSRLSIPLARVHLAPEFLLESFSAYRGLVELVGFRGVFEMAWISRFKPSLEPLRGLGLEPFEYVFLRPPESKAYYYGGRGSGPEEAVYRIAVEALRRGYRVLLYPRYPEQRARYRALGGVVFLEKATDTLSLEYYSKLVVTGGATMATEAALMGTPSLYLFPRSVEVPSYVASLGFPVYHASPGEAVGLAVKLMESTFDREVLLGKARRELGDPVPAILDVVKRFK